MSYTAPFTIKRGDTLPELVRTLNDANGPVDLTGASVRFLMSHATTGAIVIDAPADITIAASGEVSYVWQDGETDAEGTYNAEFEATFQDGRILTFPNDGYMRVTITRSVDDPGVAPPVASVSGQPRQAVGVFVRKATAGALATLSPVRAVGQVGGYVTVEAATLAGGRAIGLMAAPVSNIDAAFSQRFGLLVGVDTSAWSIGQRLYLADAGGITTDPGAGRQHLGIVLTVSPSAGSLLVEIL